MKDFCNVAEKDCVRLIVAQDLKEFGIDVDTNLGGGLGNLTASSTRAHHGQLINTSTNLNGTNCSHFHNNSLVVHNHHVATLGSNLKEFITSSKHHNKSTMSALNDHGLNSGCVCNSKTSCGSHDPHNSTRVFGIHLNKLEHVSVTVNEQILNVPIFLKYAVDFLNELIHVEGIFRRNGTASRLKELKKQVEEGVYNFGQFAIFDVTSLFKQFFRELPESLLTFALYSNFIQAVKLDSSKSKLDSILNLCLQLPELNLNVLIYLMSFLKRITLQESSNKMNSFNLAVCFAPNIIYTKINKVNDLYINEERIVVQLLIENSSFIGKISDSVYERSLMLNSLCCSTTMMTGNGHMGSLSTTVDCATTGMNKNATNSELLFLYDNELQENCSFAHHGQSAGSTSLSSYCGSSSSTSKKEKKKRRSSSLKELMNTIQNSISKFRRRSASEKNDKTTCSIITCSSMGNGVSALSSGAGDLSCTSRIGYDVQTPYIGGGGSSSSKQLLAMPICASLYATPRINKRNAEESLQSTTKKKLMEKLPQRNLLLPNAPITPFSTTKKSKHPFKQLLSTSEVCGPSSSSSSSKNAIQPPLIISKSLKTSTDMNNATVPSTPHMSQNGQQTPSTLINTNVVNPATAATNPAIIHLQKQLKYDESPSSSLKNKLEKNSGFDSNPDCRRRLEMLPTTKHHSSSLASSCSSTSSSKHHHHHHHHREHREHHGHKHRPTLHNKPSIIIM